ncbi:uncharacterized protein PAC_11105 [Phialocephala subalpina]|uniref:Uncharacterized protein n=1 Tax=Phialocephala subalpina TaxID=576137 RepID=A0A1L7X855_9HELO|nr:uncharacterized protein PAC_11105 [Phialocephala subalpina]
MAKPSGSGVVCAADADVGCRLRSFLIICIIGTILFLVRFASHHGTRSFHIAHDSLVRIRLQSEIYVDFKQAKGHGNQAVSKYGTILPSDALLPDTLIFALEGLMWTKVIAAMYLRSFLITEVLVGWPAAWKVEIEDDKEGTGSRHHSVWFDCPRGRFHDLFAPVTCRDIFGRLHHTLPQWSAGVVGSLEAILAVPGLGYSFRHCRAWKQARVAAILLLFVIGAPIGFYFTDQVIPATIQII